MRPLLLSCALVLLARVAAAQEDPWVRVPGPPGGALPVVFETATGTLLATDETGLAFRSTTAGAEWDTVSPRDVRSFSEAPGEVFAATGTGLFRSTDDGRTWTTFALDGTAVRVGVREADGGLFAATERVLLRSTDDGRTWTTLGPAPGRLARGHDGRVYRTAERGCGAFYPCHDVLRWNPASAVWDSLTTPRDLFNGLPGTIEADAVGTVAFGTYGLGFHNVPVGGLHVRRPDGSWSSHGAYVTSVVVRPDGIFAGGYDGVYRLDASGYARTTLTPAVIVALAGRSALVAGTGIECESVLDGPAPCTAPDGGYRIDPATGAQAPLGVGTHPLQLFERDGPTNGVGVVAGGELWVYARPIVTCAYPCARQHEAWRRVPAPSLGYRPDVTSLVRTRSGWAVGVGMPFTPSLLVLRDSVWHQLGQNYLPVHDLAVTQSGAILAAGEDGIFRYPAPDTSDAGDRVSGGPRWAASVARVVGAPGVFVAYGSGGVYRSADDGRTWTRVLEAPTVGPQSGAVASAGGVWAAIAGYGLDLYHSRDEGQTWTRRGSIAPASSDDPAPVRVEGLVAGGAGVAVDVRTSVHLFLDDGTSNLPRQTWPVPWGTGRRMHVDYALLFATSEGLLRGTTPLELGASGASFLPVSGLAVAPNPFREAVTATVVVATPGRAEVFDALGRRVAVLHDGPAAGPLVLRWDVAGAAPGLYVLRVATPDGVQTARLVRVR